MEALAPDERVARRTSTSCSRRTRARSSGGAVASLADEARQGTCTSSTSPRAPPPRDRARAAPRAAAAAFRAGGLDARDARGLDRRTATRSRSGGALGFRGRRDRSSRGARRARRAAGRPRGRGPVDRVDPRADRRRGPRRARRAPLRAAAAATRAARRCRSRGTAGSPSTTSSATATRRRCAGSRASSRTVIGAVVDRARPRGRARWSATSLLERGGVVDEYLSVPEHYGPLPPGDVVALRREPDARWRG